MIRLSDLMIDTSVSVQTTKTISEDERKNAKRRLDALLDICDTEHESPSLSSPSWHFKPSSVMYEMSSIHGDIEKKGKYSRQLTFIEIILIKCSRRFLFLYIAMSTRGTSTMALNVLGEHVTEDLEYAMTPRVNLLQPENATAWVFARLTIQNFGERFRFRTDTYMGK
jgi:hypothetical protein